VDMEGSASCLSVWFVGLTRGAAFDVVHDFYCHLRPPVESANEFLRVCTAT
jgi:hypothetical protein